MTKLKGCDISKWQGIVDFGQLKPTVDFVIIRSSYGNGYADSQFSRNRDEARKVGLLVGFYHYAYPEFNSPEDEADWFCNVVSDIKDGEVLALDYESTVFTGNIVDWCFRFLQRVSSKLNGIKPLIYLNQSLVNNNDWKPVIDADFGLWLAQYDYNFDGTTVSTPWSVVPMRQYSNQEKFTGISGNVDADVFYGDAAAFKKYGYTSVVDVPNPPSTIEKIPKDQAIKDIRTGLCGTFSQEEIDADLASDQNLVQIVTKICEGDHKFYDKWIKPKVDEAQSNTQPVPEPSDHASEAETLLTKLHDVLWGKGWWFVKYWTFQKLLPK